MRKFSVKRFGLCEYCQRRSKCEQFNTRNISCPNKDLHLRFKNDAKARARIREYQDRQVADYLSKLAVTDRKQITVLPDYKVIYKPKADGERQFNSKSNTIIPVAGSEVDMIKFCENCGTKFHTVNAERRLCQKCHDEICEYLGVNYLFISKYRIKK